MGGQFIPLSLCCTFFPCLSCVLLPLHADLTVVCPTEANRQLQQRAESLASKLEGEKSTSEALRGRLTSFETMQVPRKVHLYTMLQLGD